MTSELSAKAFSVLNLTAGSEPTQSGFYQTVENGEVIESGYQDLTIKNEDLYYAIALPKMLDYNTMIKVQQWDDEDNCWVDASLELTSDSATVTELCDEAGIDCSKVDTDLYTIWVAEDLCTGSMLRYVIKEAK